MYIGVYIYIDILFFFLWGGRSPKVSLGYSYVVICSGLLTVGLDFLLGLFRVCLIGVRAI